MEEINSQVRKPNPLTQESLTTPYIDVKPTWSSKFDFKPNF